MKGIKTLFENPKFDEEFEKMIEEFTVNVCQAIDFYDVLGGDKELLGDKKEFENIPRQCVNLLFLILAS